MKERTSQYIYAFLLICLGAGLITAGREAAEEAARAAMLCLTVIIPSLFAFAVLSALTVSSGVYKLMGKPFGAVSRYIFRMPEDFFPIFLISQLAGYPIGAALISEMYSAGRLTKEQSEELLCFCIAPGPAYIMAVTRAAAPRCQGLWVTVMLSVICANTAAALVTAPFRAIPEKSEEKVRINMSAEGFTGAVRSACGSMSMICGMIIFMAAVMGILGKAGALSALSAAVSRITGAPAVRAYPFVRAFFEISNLTGISGAPDSTIPAAAALLSFGGICVQLQIKAVCRGFSPMKAALSRIPCALCAALVCRVSMPRFYAAYLSEAVAVSGEMGDGFRGYSPILSIFLLIMTILILSQIKV